VLAALGIAVSLSVKVSLVASDIAVQKLHKRAGHIDDDQPPVWGADGVDLESRGGLYQFGRNFYPWKAIPWFLVIAWIAVAIGRLTR
jgi:hypothetical protein